MDRINHLLVQLDVRIKDAWGRAAEMLTLADTAAERTEQIRLEALYGRMAATAQGLEEQRAQLQMLRDELAATAD
ncbi:MAG: hypothetical protein OXC69_08595 [Candidatus Tectomicrobia bacterium]|nr:hypothetical protein [Candidatus Tectomicrobia bacterium]